jgi:hypothetical protein
MRYTPIIGRQDDSGQYQALTPTHAPCPQWGMQGTRQPVLTRRMAHVAALQRRSWLGADVGVSQTRWAGGTSCQAPLAGVPHRGRYAWAVRTTVAHALRRDRLPYRSVLRRRPEDDRWTLSVGSSPAGFLGAHARSHREPHGECVRPHCAGGLCLDAVQDRGRTLLGATEPLGDWTVACRLGEHNAPDHLDAL